MQKYKLPLAGGAVLAALVLIYFLFFRSAGLYQAIPSSAIAVIEVANWNNVWDKLGTTATGAEIKKTAAVQKLMNEVVLLQQLVSADNSLKSSIASQNTVASLHLTSATDYDYLFTTQISGVNDNTLLNHIQHSPLVRGVNVHIFKNQKIVDVQLKDGRQLSFAKQGSVLALSFTTFLTESAMATLNSGNNLSSDKEFKAVLAPLSAKSSAKVFFNFQKSEVILPVAFKPEKIALLQDIKRMGSWGRYEVSFNNSQMELDGVITALQPADEKNSSLLSENLLSKIPDHAAYVHLSHTDTAGGNALNNYFTNWMGDTKAFVILEPLKQNYSEQNVLLVSVKNKSIAAQKLKQLAVTAGGTPTPIDTFMNTEIFNLPDGAILNQVFGNSLVTFSNCYFTIGAQAVIFCNNPDVLKLLLEKANKGETLDKDKNFLNTGFSNYGKNTSLTYVNFERSDLLVHGLLQDNSTAAGLLSAFKNAIAVTNQKDDKVFSHLTFYSGGENKATTGLVWKTKLKTETTYTPQIVFNNSTGEKEIFVQDTANNIYLLGQAGEVLFTKNTGEPVLGTVQQLDYYNNGKLQYIFNSAGHVFIVDRLGNDVGAYPLRLSAPATTGLTLVKSGSSSRYYVPCANGSVYGYEANGKPLAGWSPKTGIGLLSLPLQHLNQKRNDLFIAFNTCGKLQLLDSKGNQKWTVDNLAGFNQNFTAVAAGSNFTLLNAAGNQLTEISGDGNDKISALIDSAAAFTALSTSDSTYLYYYSHSGQMRCYNQGGEFVSSANLASANITALQPIYTGSDTYLLATDEPGRQLFILDMGLKQIASFNYGNAATFAVTDLFNRNQFMIITTDKGGSVSCYRVK